jgi:hypothetical protein
MRSHAGLRFLCLMAVAACVPALLAEERTERFDRDPGWHGYNNRSEAFAPRKITQDFGYSSTRHAGGEAAGEMGGIVTPAAEAAWYAKVIPSASFEDKLTASGKFAYASGPGHLLIGFFNADTVNEWRTPNTIALRILGRGERFYAFAEYMTKQWRAGGDNPGGFPTEPDPESGKPQLVGFEANRKVHEWSLTYDPKGNNGSGSITLVIDGQTCVCNLDPGHKQDGATFNRFGVMPVMKQWDDPGEVWLDDVTVNGERQDFSADPGWEGKGNRRTYLSGNVRPRFDFGYSPTHFAGGISAGELGGLVFSGDIRDAKRMAFYGDKLDTLSLEKPLRASGTIALRRAVSDSAVLMGFFNSQESARTNRPAHTSWTQAVPKMFLGFEIEGPSSEGFRFYPIFRATDDALRVDDREGPHILPDGSVHRWTLEYEPRAGKPGLIRLSFDGRSAGELEVPPDEQQRPRASTASASSPPGSTATARSSTSTTSCTRAGRNSKTLLDGVNVVPLSRPMPAHHATHWESVRRPKATPRSIGRRRSRAKPSGTRQSQHV